MTLRHLPNVLSVGRMLAVPPLVWLLVVGHYDWALIVAVAAGLTDLLDGWLARRFGWQTRFGSLADPAADKIMMVASYATLAALGYLPWWLFGLVILRDLVIVIGGWVYHLRFARLEAQPTRLSKINTVFQVVLMWYVLIVLAGLPLPAEGKPILIGVVAVLGVLTLVHYTWLWSNKAAAVSRARRAGGGG